MPKIVLTDFFDEQDQKEHQELIDNKYLKS